MISFFLKVLVPLSVKREFTALAESLCAAVDSAYVWCFTSVCKLMLFEVLVKCEFFPAMTAF